MRKKPARLRSPMKELTKKKGEALWTNLDDAYALDNVLSVCIILRYEHGKTERPNISE